MHKSYRPVKPAQSKLLQYQWDTQQYENHRKRVASTRPQIDTRPPHTYAHLHLKLKKLQKEEERMTEIDRENRILLEKMTKRMKTDGELSRPNKYRVKSLNEPRRNRIEARIQEENKEMVKRIGETKSVYNRDDLEKDWKRSREYMSKISAYPEDWWVEPETKNSSPNSSKKK